MTDFRPQRAQRIVHHLRSTSAKEDEVSILCGRALYDGVQRIVRKVFYDRRLHAVTSLGDFVEFDIGETFRAIYADEFRVRIDLAAGQRGAAARYEQAGDSSAGG